MTEHPSTETTPAPAGRRREGFALPMAILVIAFLTVTIAAAYAATSSELVTNNAQRGESRAYMLAQAGLENFMARRNEVVNGVLFCAQCGAPPTTTYESTTVTLPGGYAQVVAQQVRTANNTRPAIYLMRSRGVDTSNVVNGLSMKSGMNGTGVQGERTVAQMVYWNVNQVNVLSGWTSATGLTKKGTAGAVSGVDACGVKGTVAGIAVPAGTYVNAGGGFDPEGSPPISYLGTTQTALQTAVKVDWDGIINGNRIQPDYVFANNTDFLAAWPAFTTHWAADPNWYPVIRVNGNAQLKNLSSGGRGTLIVLGDLDMEGDDVWDGIVLVGGVLTSNGNGTISGATESGLNALLTNVQITAANNTYNAGITNTPGPSIANGTKAFQYNSCDVAKAAGGLASYSVYPNAWMDNIVTY
jgi:hypothetical protein